MPISGRSRSLADGRYKRSRQGLEASEDIIACYRAESERRSAQQAFEVFRNGGSKQARLFAAIMWVFSVTTPTCASVCLFGQIGQD